MERGFLPLSKKDFGESGKGHFLSCARKKHVASNGSGYPRVVLRPLAQGPAHPAAFVYFPVMELKG